MISEGALRAMRKKAGEGRPPPDLGPMTLTRGWRAAVPRAAEESMGLIAAATGVQETRIGRDDLVRDLPEGVLLALLEGPNEHYGVAILDPQLLAGIIEVQTTGRVTNKPAQPRAPTRTDAVISADFLDRLMEIHEESLSEMEDPPPLAGFRYATFLADPRLVEITLDEGACQLFSIALDLDRGAKRGELRLAFPVRERRNASREDEDGGLQAALRSTIMESPTEIVAVLHRVPMSLGDVMRLSVGDVVPVPLSKLSDIRLDAGSSRTVATARLGQSNGFRAVRLKAPVEPGGNLEGNFSPARPSRSIPSDLDTEGADLTGATSTSNAR